MSPTSLALLSLTKIHHEQFKVHLSKWPRPFKSERSAAGEGVFKSTVSSPAVYHAVVWQPVLIAGTKT